MFGFGISTTGQGSPDRAEKPAKGSKWKACGSFWKDVKRTRFRRGTNRVEPSTSQQDAHDPEMVSVQIFVNPNQTPEQVCLPGQICEDQESLWVSGSSRIDQTPDADPEKAVLNTLLPRNMNRVAPSTPQQDSDDYDLESVPINVNPNPTPGRCVCHMCLPGEICEKQEILNVSRASSFEQLHGQVCLPSQICEVRESVGVVNPSRIEQTPDADPEKAVLNTRFRRETKRVEPSTPQQDDLESVPINVNPKMCLPGQICEKQEILYVSRFSSFEQSHGQVSQICEVRESPCVSGSSRNEQTPAADPELLPVPDSSSLDLGDKKTKDGSILKIAGAFFQNLFHKTVNKLKKSNPVRKTPVADADPERKKEKAKKGTWKNSRYYTSDCFTTVYREIGQCKKEEVEVTIRIHKDDYEHLKDLKHSFPYEEVLIQVEQKRRLGRLSRDPTLTALYQFVGNEPIVCVYKEKPLPPEPDQDEDED